jgi:hypothetical protein
VAFKRSVGLPNPISHEIERMNTRLEGGGTFYLTLSLRHRYFRYISIPTGLDHSKLR